MNPPALVTCDRCTTLVEPHVQRCGTCRKQHGPATPYRAGIAKPAQDGHGHADDARERPSRVLLSHRHQYPRGVTPRGHAVGPGRAANRNARIARTSGFPTIGRAS